VQRVRILIVAADPDVAELYAVVLTSSLTCTTASVPDVEAAREALQSGAHWNAVLFDVGREASWGACADLSAAGGNIPVVVVTGWASADGRFRRQAFAGGCVAFVLKPCCPDVLAEAVRRVLRGDRDVEFSPQ
jgi:CheY-like chemotaxis protein